jgi:hypothetical protein
MSQGKDSERRRAPRMEMRIPAHISMSALKERPAKPRKMITRDVSQLGAFFECKEPFPLAAEIKMILDLGKHVVEAMGKVVRVDSLGMAVAFSQAQVLAPVPV